MFSTATEISAVRTGFGVSDISLKVVRWIISSLAEEIWIFLSSWYIKYNKTYLGREHYPSWFNEGVGKYYCAKQRSYEIVTHLRYHHVDTSTFEIKNSPKLGFNIKIIIIKNCFYAQ